MKRISVSALALAFGLVAFAGDSHAQVRPFTIGISGGPSFPTGDLGDETSTGYHVQGSVGFGLAMLPIGLRLDALWQELPDVHDGTMRQIGGLLNGTFGLPLGVAQPYGLVGVGLLNSTEAEEHGGGSENTLGFNAGVGIQFPFVGMSGVIEARYLNLFGSGEATHFQSIPVSFGIRF
jgi:hypothetical protein